jgi:hypothetical protein
MKKACLFAGLLLATSAVAQLGGGQQPIGKSTPPKSALSAPPKSNLAPPAATAPPTGSAGAQKADLRIVKVEHKLVVQGCKPATPFAEVVATVKNKGNAPSAGLNDPSAIAAVFKVNGAEQRFPAAGGLMPLPPDGSQVVVMKIPYNDGLFPVEKLPDGWLARKNTTSYQIQINAAGLIDESKAGDKGALHSVQVSKEQCPDLYHTVPPVEAFVQFQDFCQKNTAKVKNACGANIISSAFGTAMNGQPNAQQQDAAKKLPNLCNACKAACPTCGFNPFAGIGG